MGRKDLQACCWRFSKGCGQLQLLSALRDAEDEEENTRHSCDITRLDSLDTPPFRTSRLGSTPRLQHGDGHPSLGVAQRTKHTQAAPGGNPRRSPRAIGNLLQHDLSGNHDLSGPGLEKRPMVKLNVWKSSGKSEVFGYTPAFLECTSPSTSPWQCRMVIAQAQHLLE